jgi:hypothetical protein
MELSRRSAMAIAGVILLVLVGAGWLLLGSGGDSSDTGGPGSSGPGVSTVPTTQPNLVAPSRGPAPPSDGAWVGAWVKPDVQTQAGRLEAVSAFEREIGRPLDLVHVYHSTEDFPAAADTEVVQQGKTLMISWSGDDTRVVTSGRDDVLIRQRAEEIKALGAPILLRWRFEMNRPNLQASIWSPADYVAAWKHVRAIFTEVGATNAAWVWCPLATDFDATDGPAYYPGDGQVEWLCADVYPGPDYSSFGSVSEQFMAWAATHAKPIIIGEFGAEDSGSVAQRADWITGVDQYVRTHPQIKAVVYFDARRNENGNDRDFTLSGTGAPLAAFRKMVLNPYFDKLEGAG